mmetsp:Transcript_10010/g.15825  ORF Transcript_10010/g.15825 Transcript_10010/m.15825 type:complete len:85 (-) Transcript_10010:66-320(-)
MYPSVSQKLHHDMASQARSLPNVSNQSCGKKRGERDGRCMMNARNKLLACRWIVNAVIGIAAHGEQQESLHNVYDPKSALEYPL